MDKKRIVAALEKSIEDLTARFEREVKDVRHDFGEDIRLLRKLRARDKSDTEIEFGKVNTMIDQQ